MTKIVGQSVKRVDAYDKVTGRAIYASDVSMPGMLHLKLVFAGRPHARILSIDLEDALKQPGVKAVLTALDVPHNRYGISVHDRPVLCGDKVRHAGDPVAVVAAETPQQAAAAARLVRILYDDLPVVDDPEQALLPGVALVHEDHPGNIAHKFSMRTGDVEQALARSDVVVSHEYRTPMQEHVFMEPEAGLGYIDEEGRVTLITAGQDTHEDQQQIAEALDLPASQVRVIYPAIGGSFGGREDLSMQPALALAAWKLRQPVKMAWNREESIIGHHKRHAFVMRYTWGATREGLLTAAKMEIISDAGAYCLSSNSVLDNLRFAATGPYNIPVVSLEARTVYTNNVPAGAFRGFGFPQTAFAAEMQMNYLAEVLGIDPITIRLLNCFKDDSRFATRAPVPGGVSLVDLLQACAREAGAVQSAGGWQMPETQVAPGLRRSWGIALGMKSAGFGLGFPEHSAARVELYGDTQIERAVLYTAAADVGQGTHTVLAQICAEALDLSPEKIRLVVSDTASSSPSGPASASRLTLFAGNAVRLAAEAALRDWNDESRPAVGEVDWQAPPTTAPDPVTGECINSITMSYAAHAAEVEVEMDTGIARLKRVIAVHDPGKAVNPQQVLGQIEGGAIQAQGWALIENLVSRNGRILTDKLSTYLIPTSMDIPVEFRTTLLELPDPIGPYGVRGLGEIPFIPLAPAIAMAVRNAVGVWSDQLPIQPARLLREIRKNLPDS